MSATGSGKQWARPTRHVGEWELEGGDETRRRDWESKGRERNERGCCREERDGLLWVLAGLEVVCRQVACLVNALASLPRAVSVVPAAGASDGQGALHKDQIPASAPRLQGSSIRNPKQKSSVDRGARSESAWSIGEEACIVLGSNRLQSPKRSGCNTRTRTHIFPDKTLPASISWAAHRSP